MGREDEKHNHMKYITATHEDRRTRVDITIIYTCETTEGMCVGGKGGAGYTEKLLMRLCHVASPGESGESCTLSSNSGLHYIHIVHATWQGKVERHGH